jgi:hypothetical protein
VEAVVTAAAHVDDGTGFPAIPAVAAKVTPTETATAAAAEAPIAMVATTEASAPAGVAAAEACASKVSPAKAATAEVTATATGMPAEGGYISGREHADRNRDGDGSEHGLENLADHGNLQYIVKRTVPTR